MPHLVRWNEELRDFGLVIISAHVQKATSEEIKAKAESLGVNFPVVGSAQVVGGNDFNAIPHCMLFDHTGKCLFRGSPAAVEQRLRSAVGAALIAGTGKSTFSKTAAPLVESLKKGQAPTVVLQKAAGLQKSATGAAADEIRLLVTQLQAGGLERIEQSESLKKENPIEAYDQLKRVITTFKGSSVAAKGDKILQTLKNDKAVQAELKARPSLKTIQKLDRELSARAGGKIDPKGPEFQRTFAVALQQMRQTLQRMKKSWPDAKATQTALALADKYLPAGK
jgi:hypothetical protein